MVPVRQLLLPFCLLYIICVIRHFGYVFVHFASRRINEGAIKKRILLFFFLFSRYLLCPSLFEAEEVRL